MESLAAALVNDGQTTIANALLAHYREIGVTNDELLVYLQFKRLIDQGNQFPDAAVIAKSLGESTNAVFQRLHEMLAKKLLTIESITADDQKIHDRYNFDGLYDKLAVALKKQPAGDQVSGQATNENRREKVFRAIQTEFGRDLSPIEMESISKWFDEDHYEPEVIELALREAVLRQVYNLTYMDRILLNWQKRNLKTAAQVEAERQRSIEQRLNSAPQPQRQTGENAGPKIPLFKLGEDQS
ncbi:DnaD domain-containing protein [Lactiplantibacillus argentoratensis]|uniref:DnaD domain protein n=1 Tax=Lactiplantibacillus argentoratensis TaxID=271881 RepID=A0ABS5UHB4_9LACO|nr:DnaD domain protein [Lactiplantibacillus argentoratensis]KZU15976.1 Chromosome replication initiation protein DnaD [Lactiplantibacillus plantarum]MBP5808325.1 DnaD domain protein [Lactiplantibacillus argentoratensis]MBT1137968.1 DnaD domain protein [Lactiplantibacillus argentoratensis]MBT1140825.1 DnaD domain protein [Lactiplantibacillus argentoratensis]MCA5598388.1 DnaD domain protein [Lactiplantibacillus argentoratensis]